MCSVDKEGTHVVMLSANLQLTVRNIHSVLALAGVALEAESVEAGVVVSQGSMGRGSKAVDRELRQWTRDRRDG